MHSSRNLTLDDFYLLNPPHLAVPSHEQAADPIDEEEDDEDDELDDDDDEGDDEQDDVDDTDA